MKLQILLLLLAWIYVMPSEGVKTHWLEMPLDHFNLFDNRTWKMRYMVNNKFFQKGKPLFLAIGGEGTIHPFELQSGQLYTLAKKHHGMLVLPEHRYYGESLPFTNFTTENLKYLQIEQALEDLAYFIEYYKSVTPGLENSIVVIHGCSYPGMLATWMRLRFPHIVDIAYASSAPLGVGLDYPEYYEVVNDVYANISVDCIQSIRDGFKQMEKLIETEEGLAAVKNALRDWHCDDIDEMDASDIMPTIINVLNTQYDPIRYEQVSCIALLMDKDDTEAYERLAKMVAIKSKDDSTIGCTGGGLDADNRTEIAWSYQTCTEMGTFTTLSKTNPRHPFGIENTLKEWVDSCVEEFGDMVTEDVLRTGTERVTRRYGGKRPKVTKVVTVQGSADPWIRLADIKDYTSEAPVFVARGSHCVDISETADDPEDIIKLRKDVRNIISKWIDELS